jgi:hypothetical protein
MNSLELFESLDDIAMNPAFDIAVIGFDTIREDDRRAIAAGLWRLLADAAALVAGSTRKEATS